MDSFARGRGPRRSAQRGFTLIEIMVVVLIIGTLVVVTVLSLGATGRDSGLQQERDRLAALIAYTRERGGMLTLEYGIRCGRHGYRFVFYDNRLLRWVPETVDDTLRPRKLPAGLLLSLVIEGHPIVLDDSALKVKAVAATPPGGTVSASSGGLGSITGSGGLSGLSSSGGLGNGGFSRGGLSSSGSSYGSTGLGSGFTSLGSSSGSSSSFNTGSSSGSSTGGGSGLDNQPDSNMPQIMLFSNGDTNTFALTMQREGVNRTATIQSSDDGDGTIKVGDIVEPKR
jgi:type II secretion system protein H